MRCPLLLIACALTLALPSAVSAAPPTALPMADSVQPGSSVSLAVEPALSDGRLVIKLAIKNLAGTPVQLGPSNVTVSKPTGEPIPLYPMQDLINDVRVAAGMPIERAPGGAPAAGGYAAPQMPVTASGQVDVSGYTGGTAVAGDETVRRTRRSGKPSIGNEEAHRQIAALRSAILQESSIEPGQIAAGQLVSRKLNLKNGEDRTLHVRIQIGADEHAFTIAAPKS